MLSKKHAGLCSMSAYHFSTSVFSLPSALRARRAAYELLARLWLAPLNGELAATLRELPGFAEHLPVGDTSPWLDELAVEYERLFGQNVYPYESIFRDHELMLNTAAAERVAALYRDCGFEAGVGPGGAPDHLGLELRLMAALIAREEQAVAHRDTPGIHWARARQAECLHAHLAQWAPICAQTVGRAARHPLYASLAGLTAELIGSDLVVLPARPPANDMPTREIERGLPGISKKIRDDLSQSASSAFYDKDVESGEDERGMNQLARQLLTADCVGVFLCRADMAALGRALDLPVPMGDRAAMLRGLFEAAGQFDQLPALLGALDRVFAGAGAEIAALRHDFPAWAPYGEPWRARVDAGRALLAELSAQANQPPEQ
jgi:TorA maturation chaperone TorD